MEENRTTPDATGSIGKKMIFIAWGLIILLLTLIFGEWEDELHNPNRNPSSQIYGATTEVVLERNRMGHYMVNGFVNNKKATFLLDTGATFVAIPGNLAKRLNLKSGQSHYTQTANGTAIAYQTKIDSLEIGGIFLSDIRGSIVPGMQGEEILLGMTVLKQLEFTQKGNQLTLRQER